MIDKVLQDTLNMLIDVCPPEYSGDARLISAINTAEEEIKRYRSRCNNGLNPPISFQQWVEFEIMSSTLLGIKIKMTFSKFHMNYCERKYRRYINTYKHLTSTK